VFFLTIEKCASETTLKDGSPKTEMKPGFDKVGRSSAAVPLHGSWGKRAAAFLSVVSEAQREAAGDAAPASNYGNRPVFKPARFARRKQAGTREI
jgi:hypothetical protein